MSNTYYNLNYHIVFGIYNRMSLITPALCDRLYQYMGAVLKSHGFMPVMIGGTGDHVHILCTARPDTSIPDTVRDLKSASTKWINDNRLCLGRFQWQRGYGIFSVSQTAMPNVRSYIENQAIHHRRMTYAQEFRQMLDKASIEYDERFIPTDPE